MAKKATTKDPPIIIGVIQVPVVYKPNNSEFGAWCTGGEGGPRIEYANQVPAELKASTLFHESLHAMDALMNLGLTEDQVKNLEHHLPRLIVDNWKSFRPIFMALTGGKPLD